MQSIGRARQKSIRSVRVHAEDEYDPRTRATVTRDMGGDVVRSRQRRAWTDSDGTSSTVSDSIKSVSQSSHVRLA